ncbi:MAG: clpS [Mycobacterium sp.]|jgi:ATP-dependent Clp protease adaptor protein ClpS|nr:clpS [Mycobacterium sp.]MCW2745444.1 clpS [Mycobacterium sp.]
MTPAMQAARGAAEAVSPAAVKVVTATTVAPERTLGTETGTAEQVAPSPTWVTVVWDDPVNLMDYVTRVFQQVFGYSKGKAKQLMLQVHHEGRAVVSKGSREDMERDVTRLHERGLWATVSDG